MNLLKLAAGLAVLGVGLWVLVGEHLAGASANAVVNAQLATVRSPISGEVSFASHEAGRAILAGEALGSVTDRLVDLGRLRDLERERAELMPESPPAATDQEESEPPAGQDARPASRLGALAARIAAEQVRLNDLSTADLLAPANGLVWQHLSHDGETVVRGQDLVRIVACDTAVVTASVNQSLYNGLRVGQAVTFRFDSDGEVYQGSIQRLAGTGAERVYANMAVAPSSGHLERYDVAVIVPALRDVAELRCLIGRTGRVFFDRRPADALRAWLSL